MSSRMRMRKKEEKPPPPIGPGSKVVALPFHVKRHVVTRPQGPTGNLFELNFSTTSSKSLPLEVYKNEELMNFTRRLDAQNNRIKKLPRSISALQRLEHIDLSNN